MNNKYSVLKKRHIKINQAVFNDADLTKLGYLINLNENKLNKSRVVTKKSRDMGTPYWLHEFAQKNIKA